MSKYNANSPIFLVNEYGKDAPIELRLTLSSYNNYILQYRIKNPDTSFIGRLKNLFNDVYTWRNVKIPLRRDNWESKENIDRFEITDSSDSSYLYIYKIYSMDNLYSKDGIFTEEGQKLLYNTYKTLGDLPEYQDDVIDLVNALNKRNINRFPDKIYIK